MKHQSFLSPLSLWNKPTTFSHPAQISTFPLQLPALALGIFLNDETV